MSVNLPAGASVKFSFDAPVPLDAELGKYAMGLVLDDGSAQIAADGALATVAAPLTIASVNPIFPKTGGKALSVTLNDNKGTGAKGGVEASIKGVPESRKESTFALPPKGSTSAVMTWNALDAHPAKSYEVVLKVKFDDGYSFQQTRNVNFLRAAKFEKELQPDSDMSSWKHIEPFEITGREWLVRSPEHYAGVEDSRASFRFGWDERFLYLWGEVDDDVFLQNWNGFETWKGDCLQCGFDVTVGTPMEATGNLVADAGFRRHTEIDLALTANGPESFRTRTFDKDRLPVRLLSADELKLHVTKKDRPGGGVTLTYDAAIPWKTLGADQAPKSGDSIGVAITVNDLDEMAPQQLDPSALGIFVLKDPAKFGRLYLDNL